MARKFSLIFIILYTFNLFSEEVPYTQEVVRYEGKLVKTFKTKDSDHDVKFIIYTDGNNCRIETEKLFKKLKGKKACYYNKETLILVDNRLYWTQHLNKDFSRSALISKEISKLREDKSEYIKSLEHLKNYTPIHQKVINNYDLKIKSLIDSLKVPIPNNLSKSQIFKSNVPKYNQSNWPSILWFAFHYRFEKSDLSATSVKIPNIAYGNPMPVGRNPHAFKDDTFVAGNFKPINDKYSIPNEVIFPYHLIGYRVLEFGEIKDVQFPKKFTLVQKYDVKSIFCEVLFEVEKVEIVKENIKFLNSIGEPHIVVDKEKNRFYRLEDGSWPSLESEYLIH